MDALLLTTNPGLEDLVADEFRRLADAAGVAYGPIEATPLTSGGRVRIATGASEAQLEGVWRRMRSVHHAIRFLHRFELPENDPLGEIARRVAALEVPGLAEAASFRVSCSRVGEHPFQSPEVERAAGAAVVRRHGTPVRLKDPEFVLRVDMRDSTCEVGVQYTRASLARRHPRVYSPPAALKTTVAWALLELARPAPERDRRLLDPFCGAGTILLEAAASRPHLRLFGSDLNPKAVDGTLRNARSLGLADRLETRLADARELSSVWEPGSMSLVITNPPFGVRLRKGTDFKTFYGKVLNECARVLSPGGRLVMLVLERGAFNAALAGCPDLARRHVRIIETGALHPAAFVLQRV